MRFIVVFIFSLCVAFPAFSQTSNSDRFKALSDSMGRTISNGNSMIDYYAQDSSASANVKSYSYYNKKHETLKSALNKSQDRLDLLIRTNDRTSYITEEQSRYQDLVRQLEDLKKEYDNWLSSVR